MKSKETNQIEQAKRLGAYNDEAREMLSKANQIKQSCTNLNDLQLADAMEKYANEDFEKVRKELISTEEKRQS